MLPALLLFYSCSLLYSYTALLILSAFLLLVFLLLLSALAHCSALTLCSCSILGSYTWSTLGPCSGLCCILASSAFVLCSAHKLLLVPRWSGFTVFLALVLLLLCSVLLRLPFFSTIAQYSALVSNLAPCVALSGLNIHFHLLYSLYFLSLFCVILLHSCSLF